MSFAILGRPLRKIGVIGSGQIGPDIALYFAKIFHRFDVPIEIVDISEEALAAGRTKLDRKVDKGVETKAFSPEMAAAMKSSCNFGSDYEALRGADLIVEAATENRDLKQKIFAQVESLVDDTAVLASNSSHLEPEVIFANAKKPERCLVIHYFFPAERNPIVEIVPGAATDPAITADLLKFYEGMGKAPIQVGSRFGYALDPIFEGMFHAAALLVEKGVGTTREVDAVACRAVDLTVGPFTAMNLTGGNPITHPALGVYAEKVMPWFRTTQLLTDAVSSGDAWDVPKRGEKIEIEPEREARIVDALRGAYFGLITEVLDSGIATIADLDMAAEIALDLAPPFQMMNDIGVPESLALVEKYAAEFEGFKVSEKLKQQAAQGKPWEIPTVLRQDVDGVAVLKIRRPKVLNALNESAFDQLEQHCRDIESDASVVGGVITGFGVKAFVSGADVNFLAEIDSAAMGEQTSLGSQRSLAVIENLKKPIVCAMNGFAFGGGNELAMACHGRIARKGLSLLACQPEPNLGIIPGAGATQRLPRWVGWERAAMMLRTGRGISSAEAAEAGLIQREVEGDLVGEAVAIVRAAADGSAPLTPIEAGPIEVPDTLPEVAIGHLSKAVDAIICRAIVEGCGMPLTEGLAFEAKMFGEVCATEDMKIGVQNFLTKGPRSKAEFVHR